MLTQSSVWIEGLSPAQGALLSVPDEGEGAHVTPITKKSGGQRVDRTRVDRHSQLGCPISAKWC